MVRFDKRLLLNFDWIMLLLVLMITVMGLINLYSSTHGYPGDQGTSLFLKQIYVFIMGSVLMVGLVTFDYRRLLVWNYSFYLAVVALLIYALVLGKSIANTQRWIDLGFFRLQPSEPAKLMMVITIASYYFRKDTGKGFTLSELMAPIGLVALPFLLILKQPDLGTALMIGFVFISLTLFVKLKWSTMVTLVLLFAIAIPIGWSYVLKPYQKQRIETFLNPEDDPMNSGYHILQSKIAVGSGSKLGKGYLQGTQVQLDFLPERHTDFAFSVWAEEWGFVGSLIFLACYFLLILWGLNIAISSRDKFGVLLSFGVISLIFWQAFINLAMVLGLMPVVGMPLPFFSYGGSPLLTNMAGVGILMNIRMRRFIPRAEQRQA